MTLSTFLGFFWKSLGSSPSPQPRLPEIESPDIAVLEAHHERAKRYLQEASDLASLETRMKMLERERGWW
jgi:hypothetical protein